MISYDDKNRLINMRRKVIIILYLYYTTSYFPNIYFYAFYAFGRHSYPKQACIHALNQQGCIKTNKSDSKAI